MHDVLCSTDDESARSSARRAELAIGVARGEPAAVARDLHVRTQDANRNAARDALQRAAGAARVQANTPANSAEGQRASCVVIAGQERGHDNA